MSYDSKTKFKFDIRKLEASDNVAAMLDEEQQDYVGGAVKQWYEADEQSRSKWKEKNKEILKLALQVAEQKSYPWPNASNVKFPLITIAALQFSSRVYPALIKVPDLVKYRKMGSDPMGMKAARAHRVSKYMSYQLLDELEEWEEEQDRLFVALPIIGCGFKKTYQCPIRDTIKSRVVLPQDFVVHYYTKDLDSAERMTECFELYDRQIMERKLRNVYVDVELGSNSLPQPKESDERQGLSPPYGDDEHPRKILECHCWWDMDGDGYKEPYVVTVDHSSGKLLRMVSRFEKVISQQSLEIEQLQKQIRALMETVAPPSPDMQVTPEMMQGIRQVEMQVQERQMRIEELAVQKPKVVTIEPIQYFTKYGMIPSPDGGFYDLGFGGLMHPINESVNTLMNQLIDSGALQNGSQGFIGRGARIKGGRIRFEPFEWKQVSVPGQALRDSFVPLPVNPPSPVLFQMLGLLIDYAQRISSVTDTMTGQDPGQNTPAYNMSAMLEQGLQVFNGIFKRIYRSFRKEVRKVYVLNSKYLDPETYITTMDGQDVRVLRDDFGGDPKDLVPAADPNAFSNMESLMKAHFLAERSQIFPGGYDPVAVERRLLESMDIPDVQEIFPLDEQGQPVVQPPENPELVIKTAEEQRRTLESRSRMELDAARAYADVSESEANILMKMAQIQDMGDKTQLEELRLIHDEMKSKREALLKVAELEVKEKEAKNRNDNQGTEEST